MASSPEMDDSDTFFLHFFFPVGILINSDKCNYDALMANPEYLEQARRLSEDISKIQAHERLTEEIIFDMFARRFVTFMSNDNHIETITIKEDAPPKKCYEFVKVMMEVCDQITDKKLDETVVAAATKWLGENKPAVKSAGKA